MLQLPRLSVDIEFNYIGNLDRDQKLAEQAQIEQFVQTIFTQEGFSILKMLSDDAGRK